MFYVLCFRIYNLGLGFGLWVLGVWFWVFDFGFGVWGVKGLGVMCWVFAVCVLGLWCLGFRVLRFRF